MFDDYLAGLPDDQRRGLHTVVEAVAAVAPDAVEGRSYGMPAFRYHGRPLVGFAAHRTHLAVYPFGPAVVEAVRAELDGYDLSKGTIRFAPDHPLPEEVLTRLVELRMREIDDA